MKNILLFCVFMAFMEGVFGDEVSVTEGDTVPLKTGLSEIQTNDFIEWRFGGTLIARVIKASGPTTYDDALNGKFKDRLSLNIQTGDLTISNIKTSDSGEYKVSNSIDSFKNNFNVSVSAVVPKPVPETVPESAVPGLSPGAIAGIVIGVLAAVAAAVGGIVYGYGKKGPML